MPDPSRLAAVHASCFTLPRPWSASEFAALLDSAHVFVVTESDGFVMGRAVAGEAELLTIAVMPEARRHGTGSRLVDAFMEQARARGAETAFLEVAAGNAAAIALYERAGFARSGQRKGYYRGPDGQTDDALVLFRVL